MKSTIAAALLATSLAGPVLAQSVGEQTGVNSALGIAPKTDDFVKEAALSDMTEIEAARELPSRREIRKRKNLRSR
jgi:putative membrane protein